MIQMNTVLGIQYDPNGHCSVDTIWFKWTLFCGYNIIQEQCPFGSYCIPKNSVHLDHIVSTEQLSIWIILYPQFCFNLSTFYPKHKRLFSTPANLNRFRVVTSKHNTDCTYQNSFLYDLIPLFNTFGHKYLLLIMHGCTRQMFIYIYVWYIDIYPNETFRISRIAHLSHRTIPRNDI